MSDEKSQNPNSESRLTHLQNVFARMQHLAATYVPIGDGVEPRSRLAMYADLETEHGLFSGTVLLDAIKEHDQEAFDIALAKISDANLNHLYRCRGHSLVYVRGVEHTLLQKAYTYNFQYAIDALLARGVEDDPDASMYQGESHICERMSPLGILAPLDEGL